VGGTALLVVVIAAVIGLLVSLFMFGADPDSIWWHGRRDPIRNLFFRPNGTWRRFGRLGLLCAIAVMLLIGALVTLRHAA
jgi:hypothetical protein